METKRDRLMMVIAISALFVIAGFLYIWSFSDYIGDNHLVLSPFDTTQGVQLSPNECRESCPYNVDVLCEAIWKC